jgi:hypothetical protein
LASNLRIEERELVHVLELVSVERPAPRPPRSQDDEKMAELGASGCWELVERWEEFQAMPTREPEVRVRVWAFRTG